MNCNSKKNPIIHYIITLLVIRYVNTYYTSLLVSERGAIERMNESVYECTVKIKHTIYFHTYSKQEIHSSSGHIEKTVGIEGGKRSGLLCNTIMYGTRN